MIALARMRDRINSRDSSVEKDATSPMPSTSNGNVPLGNSKIKIKQDVQLVPPRKDWDHGNTEWIQVVKKGKKKKVITENKQKEENNQNINQSQRKKENKKKERVIKKLPKSAAISIKGSNKNFSYADALKKARTEISLENLEINIPKIRKGMNGATIIEIYGEE